jgi:hypothetical protein
MLQKSEPHPAMRLTSSRPAQVDSPDGLPASVQLVLLNMVISSCRGCRCRGEHSPPVLVKEMAHALWRFNPSILFSVFNGLWRCIESLRDGYGSVSVTTAG